MAIFPTRHALRLALVVLASSLALGAYGATYVHGDKLLAFTLVAGQEQWVPQMQQRVLSATWRFADGQFTYKPAGGTAVHGTYAKQGTTLRFTGTAGASSTVGMAGTAIGGTFTTTTSGGVIEMDVATSMGTGASVNGSRFAEARSSAYRVRLRVRPATAAEVRRFDTTDDAGNAKFQFGRIEEGR